MGVCEEVIPQGSTGSTASRRVRGSLRCSHPSCSTIPLTAEWPRGAFRCAHPAQRGAPGRPAAGSPVQPQDALYTRRSLRAAGFWCVSGRLCACKGEVGGVQEVCVCVCVCVCVRARLCVEWGNKACFEPKSPEAPDLSTNCTIRGLQRGPCSQTPQDASSLLRASPRRPNTSLLQGVLRPLPPSSRPGGREFCCPHSRIPKAQGFREKKGTFSPSSSFFPKAPVISTAPCPTQCPSDSNPVLPKRYSWASGSW